MKKEKAEVALFNESGEVSYRGYKRQPITIHHYKDGRTRIKEKITFPSNHSPETCVVSHAAIYTNIGVIWEGPISPPVKIDSCVAPQFNTSDLTIEEE